MLALLAIAAVAAAFVYAFDPGVPLGGRFTLHAEVANSVDVRAGSPVRIAGIDVGTVRGTSADGRLTEITFTINPNGLPIHTDATMAIRDRLFLEGNYYLQIDPGTPSAPQMRSGDTIPPDRTSSPVQFYKLLSTFTQPVRGSLGRALQTFAAALGPATGVPAPDRGAAGLKRAIPALTPVLKNAAWVTQALTGTRPGDLPRLLRSGAAVFGTLNAHARRLNGVVTGLAHASAALAAGDTALTRSIIGADATVRAAPAALTAIDRALPRAVRLARTLTPSLRASPPLITAVTGTVGRLTRIVRPGRRGRLLGALKTTFTTLPGVLRTLGTVFPQTQALADCLNRNVLPVLNSTVKDGALSTGQPVWKEFLHFLPNVAGASGNFGADGHYTRILLGAGSSSLTGGDSATLTGTLNSVGKLVGLVPGDSPLTGAAPQRSGPLTAADFRPDVSCTSQPVPALTAAPGEQK